MVGRFSPSERLNWLKGLPKVPSSAALLLTDSKGNLLIVKANYKHHWSLPGGMVEERESPRDGALREAREEIGLEIDSDRLSLEIVAFRASAQIDTYQFVFKAEISDEEKSMIVLQQSEIEDYAFVTKEQILSAGRTYSPVIVHWAKGMSGYIEYEVSF